VSGPAFDSSQRLDRQTWSRRDFVKLSLAATGAIIARPLIGVEPQKYRVAVLGENSYSHTVVDSLRQSPSAEILDLSRNHEKSDLIVIAASDLSEGRLLDIALNSNSSVLIVSPIRHPVEGLGELTPARLQKGRFVDAGAEKRLIPEMIALPEMIQDRFCKMNGLPLSAQTGSWLHKQRVFSGWALWIDPLA
jgi:hypothetical protein